MANFIEVHKQKHCIICLGNKSNLDNERRILILLIWRLSMIKQPKSHKSFCCLKSCLLSGVYVAEWYSTGSKHRTHHITPEIRIWLCFEVVMADTGCVWCNLTAWLFSCDDTLISMLLLQGIWAHGYLFPSIKDGPLYLMLREIRKEQLENSCSSYHSCHIDTSGSFHLGNRLKGTFSTDGNEGEVFESTWN